jgi:hypothetical protein
MPVESFDGIRGSWNRKPLLSRLAASCTVIPNGFVSKLVDWAKG